MFDTKKPTIERHYYVHFYNDFIKHLACFQEKYNFCFTLSFYYLGRKHTVNLELFVRFLFSRLALKDILATFKLAIRALFICISKRKSDFAILRALYFSRNFACTKGA